MYKTPANMRDFMVYFKKTCFYFQAQMVPLDVISMALLHQLLN